METGESTREKLRIWLSKYARQIWLLIIIYEKNHHGSSWICGSTSPCGRRFQAWSILHKPTNQMDLDCLISLLLLDRSCFLVVCFALQYLFLCAGDFLFACFVLSLNAHQSGLFLFGRLMLLTVLSILAVQPRPHWLGSQILSALIADSRCHSGPLLFCWPACCTFSWSLWVFTVALRSAADPNLLTDTLHSCDKGFTRNPPHQGSFM